MSAACYSCAGPACEPQLSVQSGVRTYGTVPVTQQGTAGRAGQRPAFDISSSKTACRDILRATLPVDGGCRRAVRKSRACCGRRLCQGMPCKCRLVDGFVELAGAILVLAAAALPLLGRHGFLVPCLKMSRVVPRIALALLLCCFACFAVPWRPGPSLRARALQRCWLFGRFSSRLWPRRRSKGRLAASCSILQHLAAFTSARFGRPSGVQPCCNLSGASQESTLRSNVSYRF